jgi:hypothetical protein
MGQSHNSRIVVWNVLRKGIRYGSFAPTLLFTCCAGFAQQGIYLTPVDPKVAVTAPALVSPQVVRAPLATTPANGSSTTPPQNVTTVQAPKPLNGLGFGAGVALSFGQSRVNSAVAVGPNNIVRVTDNSPVSAGLVFESHYFFEQQATSILGSAHAITWGHGPFIALDASTDASTISTTSSTIFAGYSVGWMVGFRTLTTLPAGSLAQTQAENNSWNLGVGFHVNPKANVLGDGIFANMPLPAGESNPVRLKAEPRYGVMLLTSYGF